MAVTAFQSEILRLIARRRIEKGETYVAGGLALNHQLRRPRVSSDIDIFNSTQEALLKSSEEDCKALARPSDNLAARPSDNLAARPSDNLLPT